MPSRLLKSSILLYLLREQLVPLQEKKSTYGANPFFVRKTYLTETGKNVLNKVLLTKMVAIPANTNPDQKKKQKTKKFRL